MSDSADALREIATVFVSESLTDILLRSISDELEAAQKDAQTMRTECEEIVNGFCKPACICDQCHLLRQILATIRTVPIGALSEGKPT